MHGQIVENLVLKGWADALNSFGAKQILTIFRLCPPTIFADKVAFRKMPAIASTDQTIKACRNRS
jgi:hypothetical protein